MLKRINFFVNSRWFIVFICLLLAIIPFFWFKPGYIDIGGDSSRLYFYDPINFLNSFVLNIFLPDSLGIKSGSLHMLPFISFLSLLFSVVRFPWILNNVFYSISLVTPFLVVYAIVKEFIQDLCEENTRQYQNIRYASIVAGLFYIFIPMSSVGGWDLPLIIQSQRFVYPLLFWLLLKYLTTSRQVFLIIALLTSFLFAHDFSWVSVPNVLGFFSISLVYLLIYIKCIKKKKILIKPIILAFLLFIVLHAFHLLPLFFTIFEKNSDVGNQLLQGSRYSDTIQYLDNVASYTSHGYQFIGVTPFSPFSFVNISLVVFPLLIIFMLYKNKNIFVLIPTIFFLVVYFAVTAKISQLGFSFYKLFFLFPPLVMFRDFYGRLFEIFLLFYTLLIGYAMFIFFSLTKSYLKFASIIALAFILIINALPFLSGSISNRILTQDTGVVVKSRLQIDPNIEKILRYFRMNPSSARNITLPIADFDYQLIAGKGNDGVYFGPSMISYLSGKADLASNFTLRPFTQALFNSVKNKDYLTFENIFPILNVGTVLHNANPYIYEVFRTFPYNDAKLYMPLTQAGYSDLINNLSLKKINDFGKFYHFYTVPSALRLPIIYPAKKVIFLKQSTKSNYDERQFASAEYVLKNFRQDKNDNELRKVFLNNDIMISSLSQPNISFSKINNSKYIITVEHASGPYVLVFSQSFNTNWQLYTANQQTGKKEKNIKIIQSYFNNTIVERKNENKIIDMNILETIGKTPIANTRHYMANVFANAWYIVPTDVSHKTNYTLVLEMTDDRIMYGGILLSLIALLILLIWLVREIRHK